MASPQPNRNFARISNEILEAKASHNITGAEGRVIDFVLRETWGRPGAPKTAPLSNGDIAAGIRTGVKFASIIVNRLGRKKVLLIAAKGASRTVGIQKDYDVWLNSDPSRTKPRARQLDLFKGTEIVRPSMRGREPPSMRGREPPSMRGREPDVSPNRVELAAPLNLRRLEKTKEAAAPLIQHAPIAREAAVVEPAALFESGLHVPKTDAVEAAKALTENLRGAEATPVEVAKAIVEDLRSRKPTKTIHKPGRVLVKICRARDEVRDRAAGIASNAITVREEAASKRRLDASRAEKVKADALRSERERVERAAARSRPPPRAPPASKIASALLTKTEFDERKRLARAALDGAAP